MIKQEFKKQTKITKTMKIKQIEIYQKDLNKHFFNGNFDAFLHFLRKSENQIVYFKNDDFYIKYYIEYNIKYNEWRWINGGNIGENVYTLFGILTYLANINKKTLIFNVEYLTN